LCTLGLKANSDSYDLLQLFGWEHDGSKKHSIVTDSKDVPYNPIISLLTSVIYRSKGELVSAQVLVN